jgi:hypothetical protein
MKILLINLNLLYNILNYSKWAKYYLPLKKFATVLKIDPNQNLFTLSQNQKDFKLVNKYYVINIMIYQIHFLKDLLILDILKNMILQEEMKRLQAQIITKLFPILIIISLKSMGKLLESQEM